MQNLHHILYHITNRKTKKCCLLTAPAEIRLAIYKQLVPRSFLPCTQYQDYMGLLLSCKSIKEEMEYESIRETRCIFQGVQQRQQQSIMRLRPLQLCNFSALMNVTIEMPRWALYSTQTMKSIFDAIKPLLELHLSSLNIHLLETEDDGDVQARATTLRPREMMRFSEAYSANYLHRDQEHYLIRTTYADIVRFAARINCLLAPNLCTGDHDPNHFWCIRTNSTNPSSSPRTQYNVRKVVLHLKQLHNEVLCDCGKLPHDVCPDDDPMTGWRMSNEKEQLQRSGWQVVWADGKGRKRPNSMEVHPIIFWKNMSSERQRGFVNGVRRLLKHL